MKKYLLYLFIVSLIACKKEYQPRNLVGIKIESFSRENTSIRSLIVKSKESIAYAGSNGDFAYSNDMGKSWKVVKIRYKDSIVPHFRSLAYNGKEYFALSIANPTLLYKIYDDKYELLYKEEHEKVFYDAITFFEDKIHGIAVGDPTEDCPSILLSSDSGKSWEKLPCENLPKFADGEAFFAASNTNIKTLGSTVWIASGGAKARILKSLDYGKTWEVFNTPIIQGDGPQGIYSVDFYDENHGIIIGGNYAKPTEKFANKAITNNGGRTWELVANNKSPNYKSCITYVPNTNGKEVFAVGKTGVSFSNDGGQSWKDISKESYYAIQFVSKNVAWLSGNNKIGKLVID